MITKLIPLNGNVFVEEIKDTPVTQKNKIKIIIPENLLRESPKKEYVRCKIISIPLEGARVRKGEIVYIQPQLLSTIEDINGKIYTMVSEKSIGAKEIRED